MMNQKLLKELPELVHNKIITADDASKIKSYYEAKQSNTPNRLFTIFGVLGSLLIGLGIILVVAHNWDNLSKGIKTMLAFIPLLIGQCFVGFSIIKHKSRTWKESSGTFLFFAVGACMALISQIYNIPGNVSSFLFTWIILCVPLIYLLRSHTIAILCLVFTTYYACDLGYSFMSKNRTPWLYIPLLAAIAPCYILTLKRFPKSNIASIYNWLFPLSLTIVLGAFIDKTEMLGYLMYILLFGLFYNIGKLPFFNNQSIRRNGYLVFGSLGTIYLLLGASFKWLWKDIFRETLGWNSQTVYISIFLFITTLALLFYSYVKKWIKNFNLFQYVFILFTLLFFIGFYSTTLPTIITNILVLILGLITIKIGTDQFHFGIVNYGLLIVTALIVCRFFDTNISFELRGLLFVIVGLGFFFTNYIMLKKQKQLNRKP